MNFLNFLAIVGTAYLGVAVMIWLKWITAKTKDSFDCPTLWNENKKAILVTATGLPLLTFVLMFIPDSWEVLKLIVPLEIDLSKVTLIRAFQFGVVLYEFARMYDKRN